MVWCMSIRLVKKSVKIVILKKNPINYYRHKLFRFKYNSNKMIMDMESRNQEIGTYHDFYTYMAITKNVFF